MKIGSAVHELNNPTLLYLYMIKIIIVIVDNYKIVNTVPLVRYPEAVITL